MTEIKNMLNQYGMKSKNQNAMRVSDLLDIEGSVDNSASEALFAQMSPSKVNDIEDEDEIREFVKRQTQEINNLKAKLAAQKKQYKEDKARVEELARSDPALYKKKTAVLEKVREQIEAKIEKVNQRVAKVKEIEKKI